MAKKKSLVMKFGGTSVGTPEAIERAARIVADSLERWPHTTVVLSALSGVTNLLLEGAHKAADGDVSVAEAAADELLERHHHTIEELGIDPAVQRSLFAEIDQLIGEFRNFCEAIGVLGEATPRALDTVGSLGERLSVRIFAAVLDRMGIPAEAIEASRLIITDSNFLAAHPDWTATRRQVSKHLVPVLERGTVPVVTGFMGANPAGVITTMGRGGSDFSAAILAAALQADEVWIWTDVDGVMTADPRIVPNARTIPTLSYLELAELAYFGAKVLHPKTIRPVIEAGIGLAIRNTFEPSARGTRLLAKGASSSEQTVKAVTSIRGQVLITIEGSGMLGVPGVAARAFGAVAQTGTNVILISQASSEQSISFAVSADSAETVISAIETTFSIELMNREIDRVWASEEVVIVTVVGAGMRHTPGVAARVFSALGEHRVNVIAIAQGSSEVAISLVVAAKDMELTVRSLHDLI
ncbi:MAG: aspartate kinase [Acidobacteriota bacterium]|nr:MAG: aspartate kinase [Acidobacteriota bacterium]